MPIFGQVWLWSSLAFLLGALLCWVLVALPARRRVGELEAELAGRFRRQPPGERPAERFDRPLDGPGDRWPDRRAERAEPRHRMREEPKPIEAPVPDLLKSPQPKLPDLPREPIGRTQALPTREPGRSVRPGAFPGFGSDFNAPGGRSPGLESLDSPPTFGVDPSETELADGPRGGRGGRGWFDDEPAVSEPLEAISRLGSPETPEAPEVDRRLVDDEAEAPAESTIIFSQHTRPIPDELIREMDAQTPAAEPYEPAHETYGQADEPADGLVDDLADEDVPSAAAQTVESESVPLAESAESVAEPEPAEGAYDETAVLPAVTVPPIERILERATKPAADESSSGVGTGQRPDASTVMPGVTVRPDPDAAPLPKRVPGKRRGHTPFGVELSQTAEPEPGSDPMRALFEPVRPAEDDPVIPPPHRVRGDANGRGPFGPGSAMPLPGGESPSPEFTIKASVSALRYCTPESPQFDRTVAEVWFKTPADAERVGFRPVG